MIHISCSLSSFTSVEIIFLLVALKCELRRPKVCVLEDLFHENAVDRNANSLEGEEC